MKKFFLMLVPLFCASCVDNKPYTYPNPFYYYQQPTYYSPEYLPHYKETVNESTKN